MPRLWSPVQLDPPALARWSIAHAFLSRTCIKNLLKRKRPQEQQLPSRSCLHPAPEALGVELALKLPPALRCSVCRARKLEAREMPRMSGPKAAQTQTLSSSTCAHSLFSTQSNGHRENEGVTVCKGSSFAPGGVSAHRPGGLAGDRGRNVQVVGFLQEANGSPAAHGNHICFSHSRDWKFSLLSFYPRDGIVPAHTFGFLVAVELQRHASAKGSAETNEYASRHTFPGTQWLLKGSSSLSFCFCRSPLIQ